MILNQIFTSYHPKGSETTQIMKSQQVTHLATDQGSGLEPIWALQTEQVKELELVQAHLQTKQSYCGLAAARRATG